MQKKLVYLVIAMVLGFFGFYMYQKYRVAPSLNPELLPLQTLSGNIASLDSLKGKKTILCFSASWCGPCRAELKMLGELKQSVLKDVRVVVISDEKQFLVQRFKSQFPYDFEWLNLMQPFGAFGINSIPTAYLLNAKAEVVHQHVGFIDWEDPSTANYLLKLMEA